MSNPVQTIKIDAYVKKYARVMIIMRGVPGSGKSFAASYLETQFKKNYSVEVLSTDNFFLRNKEGVYRFNAAALGIAHKWNQNKVLEALKNDVNIVIVDNTNTTWKEIKPYAEMAKDNGYFVIIAETDTAWAKDVDECVKRNQHGVPRETIEKMLARWEPTDSIIEKLNY